MLRYSKIALIAGCIALLGQAGWQSSSALGIHDVPQRVTPPLQTNTMTEESSKPRINTVAARRSLKSRLQRMSGLASWYGSVLQGHRTASGELFDKEQLTACHRSLPFGTRVKVTSVSSGRSVVVKINDRGVLSDERVIDLSAAAARSLGILRQGVAKVKLEVVNAESGGLTPAPAF